MKYWNLRAILIASVLVVLISFQGISDTAPKKSDSDKTYTTSLTLSEWQKITGGINYTIERIRYSDLPSREVAVITDSILGPLFNKINEQVGRQMQLEKAAEQEKKKVDSIKPKKQ